MSRILLSLTISIAVTSCNSQNLSSKMKSDSLLTKKIVVDTSVSQMFNAERQMKLFADSLNNLSMDNPLPSFLFDECFDLQTAYWPDMHHPISLRQMIIKGVTNKNVIERILKEDNYLLRKKCDIKKSPPVPDGQKSFYELFKLRYAELK